MRTINTKLSKIIGGVLLMAAPAITYGQGTTQVIPQQCGTTISALDEWLYVKKVPNATDYEFRIEDVDNGETATRIKGNKYPSFNMTYFSIANYGRTYSVTARAFANGTWGNFGPACNITTPAFPSTQLSARDCGRTMRDLHDTIYAKPITGANDYEWKFVNGTNVTVVKGNKYPSMLLRSVQLHYESVYDVQVRAKVSDTWGDFGPVCQIITPAFPQTKLTDTYCNQAIYGRGAYVYAELVEGATDYEWEFRDMTTNEVYVKRKGNRYPSFTPSSIPEIQNKRDYEVRVRAFVDNTEGEFGETCGLRILDIPPTQLIAANCGYTVSSLEEFIYAESVERATDYGFQFTDASDGTVYYKNKGNEQPSFKLTYIPELTYGKTYDVKVRAKVDGTWGPFGESCEIRTPEFPSTQVSAEFCGQTFSSVDEFISADEVPGAEDYQWEFTDKATGAVYVKNKENSYPSFKLSYIPEVTYGKSYDVRVRAMKGGVWGPFGNSCEINTGAFPLTKLQDQFCGATVAKSDTIYAESVAGAVDYEWVFESRNTVSIVKGNKQPSLVLRQYRQLTPGTYNVTVRAKVGDAWGKFGESCRLTITDDISPAKSASVSTGTMPVVERKATVDIYPNPSLGNNVNLNLSNLASNGDEITVTVIDMSGKIVYSKKLNNNGENINTNLAFDTKLASGSYIVSVTAGAENFHHKMIVR